MGWLRQSILNNQPYVHTYRIIKLKSEFAIGKSIKFQYYSRRMLKISLWHTYKTLSQIHPHRWWYLQYHREATHYNLCTYNRFTSGEYCGRNCLWSSIITLRQTKTFSSFSVSNSPNTVDRIGYTIIHIKCYTVAVTCTPWRKSSSCHWPAFYEWSPAQVSSVAMALNHQELLHLMLTCTGQSTNCGSPANTYIGEMLSNTNVHYLLLTPAEILGLQFPRSLCNVVR